MDYMPGWKQIAFALPLLLLVSTLKASEIDDLRTAIRVKNARWAAAETSMTLLSPEERKMRLGAQEPTIKASDPVWSPPMRTSGVSAAATSLPTSLDYRTYNGVNIVTPVKNQGNCGSCWA